MNLPFIIRPEAIDDLQQIQAWYENERSGLDIKFARNVASLFDTIERNPEIFGVVARNTRVANVRGFPYLVFYRVLHDRIDILAVLHSHRDSSTWQDRL